MASKLLGLEKEQWRSVVVQLGVLPSSSSSAQLSKVVLPGRGRPWGLPESMEQANGTYVMWSYRWHPCPTILSWKWLLRRRLVRKIKTACLLAQKLAAGRQACSWLRLITYAQEPRVSPSIHTLPVNYELPTCAQEGRVWWGRFENGLNLECMPFPLTAYWKKLKALQSLS